MANTDHKFGHPKELTWDEWIKVIKRMPRKKKMNNSEIIPVLKELIDYFQAQHHQKGYKNEYDMSRYLRNSRMLEVLKYLYDERKENERKG